MKIFKIAVGLILCMKAAKYVYKKVLGYDDELEAERAHINDGIRRGYEGGYTPVRIPLERENSLLAMDIKKQLDHAGKKYKVVDFNQHEVENKFNVERVPFSKVICVDADYENYTIDEMRMELMDYTDKAYYNSMGRRNPIGVLCNIFLPFLNKDIVDLWSFKFQENFVYSDGVIGSIGNVKQVPEDMAVKVEDVKTKRTPKPEPKVEPEVEEEDEAPMSEAVTEMSKLKAEKEGKVPSIREQVQINLDILDENVAKPGEIKLSEGVFLSPDGEPRFTKEVSRSEKRLWKKKINKEAKKIKK